MHCVPTAEDEVQQRMSAMQGDLAASQGGQAASGNHLDPARLNLLYCYSVSCPLLTEDNESGMYIHVNIHMYEGTYIHVNILMF